MSAASSLANALQKTTVLGLLGATAFCGNTVYNQLSFLVGNQRRHDEEQARLGREADERRKKSGNPFGVRFGDGGK